MQLGLSLLTRTGTMDASKKYIDQATMPADEMVTGSIELLEGCAPESPFRPLLF